MADGAGGFVPVEEAALRALVEATESARTASEALREATDGFAELAADLKIDAVRRLQERGASAAQVARYEDAHREAARRLREHARLLDARLSALESAVRDVAD
ncbi:MAG TPA: hypothetical protein RMH99_29735 [Sandaracinaceae bacterium LLY-WYZ-13_1]|nr:hypothetical protein [Sandaracinaceae bacterium LLY-WYZ-13_1]